MITPNLAADHAGAIGSCAWRLVPIIMIEPPVVT